MELNYSGDESKQAAPGGDTAAHALVEDPQDKLQPPKSRWSRCPFCFEEVRDRKPRKWEKQPVHEICRGKEVREPGHHARVRKEKEEALAALVDAAAAAPAAPAAPARSHHAKTAPPPPNPLDFILPVLKDERLVTRNRARSASDSGDDTQSDAASAAPAAAAAAPSSRKRKASDETPIAAPLPRNSSSEPATPSTSERVLSPPHRRPAPSYWSRREEEALKAAAAAGDPLESDSDSEDEKKQEDWVMAGMPMPYPCPVETRPPLEGGRHYKHGGSYNWLKLNALLQRELPLQQQFVKERRIERRVKAASKKRIVKQVRKEAAVAKRKANPALQQHREREKKEREEFNDGVKVLQPKGKTHAQRTHLYGFSVVRGSTKNQSLSKRWTALTVSQAFNQQKWDCMRNKFYQHRTDNALTDPVIDRERRHLLSDTEQFGEAALKKCGVDTSPLGCCAVKVIKTHQGEGLQDIHFDIVDKEQAKQCWTIILHAQAKGKTDSTYMPRDKTLEELDKFFSAEADPSVIPDDQLSE